MHATASHKRACVLFFLRRGAVLPLVAALSFLVSRACPAADVFIGRVQVEPAPMHNIDLLVEDLDSGARWLRAAATENYDYQMGMRQVRAAGI